MSELSVGSLSGLAANSYVIDVASGSRLVQPGMIVAVKDALFTGTQSASVTAGSNVAVTDLSITHEVADASNKLIITAVLGVASNSRGNANTGVALHDGTGLIGVGDSAGNRTSLSSLNCTPVLNTKTNGNPSISFVYTPGAGSKTYTVRAVNADVATQTLYINRFEDDGDNFDRPRAVSSIVIQEVAV